MTSRDFCYWLQGFFEISKASYPEAGIILPKDAVDMVRRHLAMVFAHEIDPSFPADQRPVLDAIHEGAEKPSCTPQPGPYSDKTPVDQAKALERLLKIIRENDLPPGRWGGDGVRINC